jgi:hypothetical protein
VDETPRRRTYNNGNTFDQQRRKDTVDWFQCLVDTNMDQWDVRDRREMQANLNWVSEHRRTLGERQRMRLLLAGFAVTLIASFGSWIGATISNSSRSQTCPVTYVCVPAPTPMP